MPCARPAEVRLEDLPDVHARWHAQRVQHDLHRTSVRQVRHVLFRQDARDHALVAVTAGHLVAHRQLALHGDIDLDQLDHARRQFVATADLLLLLLEDLARDLDLTVGALLDLAQRVLEARVVGLDARPHQREERHVVHQLTRQGGALLHEPLLTVLVEQVGAERLAVQQRNHALLHLVVKNADFVLEVLLHHLELFGLDGLGSIVLLDALAREDLDADDDPLDARRAGQRRVLHVARLLAEDRAQQLLFRRQLGLALRRDLAHQDVARLDVGADADDAALVEVAQVVLADVRDVARDLLGPELGVAGLDLELLDVDGGVVVLLHQLLGDEDRVLEVVAAPGHERDQHVAAERELAHLRARTVGQDLPLQHLLADTDDRALVDAGVLVGPLELDQVVDVGAHLARHLVAIHAHDDALAVDVVDDAGATRERHGARVTGRDVLHARAHVRGLGAEQRHRLALHVAAHQRAVRVVVLEERDQRGRHRHELLRRDVDELDVLARRRG